MPVMQRLTIVPANGTVDNVLTGSAFEFARANQILSMGCVQEATGLFITIQTGSDIVLEESPPAISGDFPSTDSEMYYADVAVPGDRIVIRARNSTGGDINLRTLVQVTNI